MCLTLVVLLCGNSRSESRKGVFFFGVIEGLQLRLAIPESM